MEKVRLSYTLLNYWRQGKVEDAIIYYFKMGTFTNKAMEEGKKWDEYLNKYCPKNKAFPPEFGGFMLTNPQVQIKWVIEYNKQFDLVGVLDMIDGNILHENKTGTSKDSADYSSDFQVPIYLLMAHMQGIDIERAYINHYNQVSKEFDRSLIYNSKQERDRARNYIDSLAPDIWEYFKQNKLFDKRVDN